MNAFLRKALFVIVGSAIILGAGCSKKPVRPDPGSTQIMGQPGNGSINQSSLGDGSLPPAGLVDDPANSGLRMSNTDASNPDNQIRGAVASVYFAFDQSAIRQEERTKVQQARAYLNSNPDQRVVLEGRCDWRGTSEYNLGLGDRRANSVRQYLQDLGVPASRIEVLSKGDLEATENADASTSAKDRRVDFVFIK